MSSMVALDASPLAASGAPCCPPMSAQALTTQAAGQLAPMFKALGDPVRLRLLSLIAATDEICVCDLTDAFTLSGPTISHHLRVLRETGLVDVERRATWAYYRIRPAAMTQLSALLAVTGNAPAAT
jgi:ArsR family transcriptional regulator, arsenate/arsenite/antimonite-responsive transcriptional repressor